MAGGQEKYTRRTEMWETLALCCSAGDEVYVGISSGFFRRI